MRYKIVYKLGVPSSDDMGSVESTNVPSRHDVKETSINNRKQWDMVLQFDARLSVNLE